jgi:kynurenine formamidase
MPINFPFVCVDLTHSLSEDIPSWSGSCGFRSDIKLDYESSGFRVQKLTMHAGIGTHIDAPSHRMSGGKDVSDLGLDQLITHCMVIDISEKSSPDCSLQCSDIHHFEEIHGRIAKGAFVITNTGWSKYWVDHEKYRNNMNFPSVSRDAACLLLEREICGLGIDTLSPDRPRDGYPVHELLLAENKYIVENVAYPEKMPPKGAYSVVLPIKISGGTEAPIRLVGLLPQNP